MPPAARHRAIDVSRVEDVNLLYLAADVLVTDYSSVMFDFALLGAPIVFYTHDYDEYLPDAGHLLRPARRGAGDDDDRHRGAGRARCSAALNDPQGTVPNA